MRKAIKRTLGLVAVIALVLGAIRSFVLWISQTEESKDSYEVFEDEEKSKTS